MRRGRTELQYFCAYNIYVHHVRDRVAISSMEDAHPKNGVIPLRQDFVGPWYPADSAGSIPANVRVVKQP